MGVHGHNILNLLKNISFCQELLKSLRLFPIEPVKIKGLLKDFGERFF